ncbi:unnamed protein product [Amoebophrya sp. A120]|nr:unnamed protein product [Amoebophrya sp. A120]|eukprot:GSA120T00025456001.1
MIELVEVTPGTKFPLWETLLRPLGIGLLFMGATFLDMLAMQFTTLSSATLVGRVNSVTIYIASIFFLGEPSVPAKWLGVALCLSGCVLVLHLDAVSAAESGGSGGESRATSSSSTSDGTTGSSSTPGTSASNPASSSNAVLQKEYPYALYGDLAALFAVIFYTAYAITLKRFVKTTADTMWTLTLTGCFFTFLGIPGYYFFAPEFITGAYASALIEAFTIPYLVASFMFLGVIGGAGSNYLWVRSCQIVGPTMLAVGLNISIPISMLWDRFGRGFVEATSPLKLFAASLVVVGFLLVIYIDTLINEEEGKQEDQEDERAMDEADLRADINAASEQQPGPRLPGTIPSRNSTFEQLRSRTSIGVQDDAVALVLPSFPANPLLSPRAGRDGTTDHHVQGGKRTEGEMENGDKMMQQESCLGFFAGALLPLDWNRRDLVRWLLTPYYPPLPSFLSGSTASFDALAAETRKANTMKSSKPSSAPAPKKNKKWRALKNLGGQAVRNAVPNCAYCIMLILPQTIDYVLVGIMATPDTRTYALGGIALGISLINVFGIAPGIGFNQALDTLVSVAFGAKKHTKIFHYVAQAQLLIVCYMPVIILSCGICASNIFDTFATHTDPNVAAQAVEFLHSQFLFVPLFLFSDIVRKFFANVRELHHIQPYQMAAICLHGVWVYLCIEFISGRDHAAMGAGLGTSFTWLLFFLGYHLVFHKWFRTFRETTNARVLGINGPAVQPRGQQPANYTVNKKASPRGGYHSATTTSMSNNDKSSSKQEEEPVEQEHIFFLSNLSDPAVYSGHALYSYGELAVRSSANVLTEWVAREILTVLISQVSASAIAVHAAIDGTYSQLYMIPLGIAGSTATLVGSSLGMRKPVQAGRFAYVSLTLGLVAWSLMFVLLFGVPPYRWLPPPFARDADTVPHETLLHTGLQLKIADVFFPAEHNAKALFERWLFRRILIFAFAVTFWCDMGENILQGVLRACGQQQIAALVYVCQHYLLGLPVAVFLAFSTVGHGITEALVSHCNLLFLDTSVLTDGDFFAHANTMEKTSVLGLYGLWFGFSLGVVSGFVVFVYYLCVKINFRKEVKTALRRLVWHSRAAAVRGKTTDRKLSGATAKV